MDTIAYGSVYLDDLENVEEKTAEQIKSFETRTELLQFVFFDIVCKPEQIAEALAARGFVQQELFYSLGQAMGMNHVKFYVAIAFSENKRPAREAMIKLVGEDKKS